MPGQLRRLSLPRSCRVRLPSEPSRNGGHREVQAPVDHLGGGKAAFLVMSPAPERDGTDAELGPQLRGWDEFKRVGFRRLREVCLLAPLRTRPAWGLLPVVESIKIEFVLNFARATQASAGTQLCPRAHFG